MLVQPQSDWPLNTVMRGFLLYGGAAPEAVALSRLAQSLAGGEAPLVFGLGPTPFRWRVIFGAMLLLQRALSKRAMVLTGKPPEALGPLPPSNALFD